MFYTVTTPGVIIMDNFKGQVTKRVSSLLEKCHLHVCLLPASTTDLQLLQPMDISVNKPAKSFLKEQFSIWYSEQLSKQFEDHGYVPLEDIALDPVDLSLANMKKIGTNWLVEATKYIADNPQFIVNGFIHAGMKWTQVWKSAQQVMNMMKKLSPVKSSVLATVHMINEPRIRIEHLIYRPVIVIYSSTSEDV